MVTTKKLNDIPVFPHPKTDDAYSVEKTRVKLEGNVTSSLKDGTFDKWRAAPPTKKEEAQLDNWEFRLKKSEPLIEQHVEKRIALIFTMAVACYNTNYIFSEGPTIHQGFGAQTLEYGKAKKKIPFQAAHSSTLPCLSARSKDGKDNFIYLYRSSLYDESNATIDMVKEVNDADRALDEKRKDSDLRKKSITLLNRCAKGELLPEKLLEEFVGELLVEIDKSIAKEKKARVVDVLEVYKNVVEDIQLEVETPETIDQLLNLDIEHPLMQESDALINKIAEGEDIDKPQLLELIKGKVDAIAVAILFKLRSQENRANALNHFQNLYRHELLKKFEGDTLKLVEEAIGFKRADLEVMRGKFQKIDKTKRIIAADAPCIAELSEEIAALAAAHFKKHYDKEKLEGLNSEKKACLRPAIHQLRYRMIRYDQETQSCIKSKIEDTFNTISKRDPNLRHRELFYHEALLKKLNKPADKMRLCKLLNISTFQLEQSIRELKVNEQAHATLETLKSAYSRIAYCIKVNVTKKIKKDEEIKRTISFVLNELKSAKSNTGLTPLYYKRLYSLLDNPAEKALLSRLIGSDERTIDNNIAKLTKDKPAELLMRAEEKKVDEVVAVFQKEVGKLNHETVRFRGRLARELRLSHGMSQGIVRAQYKSLYPDDPMCAGSYSEMENSYKAITPKIAQQLSAIFGVSTTLFYPSHFAEGAPS